MFKIIGQNVRLIVWKPWGCQNHGFFPIAFFSRKSFVFVVLFVCLVEIVLTNVLLSNQTMILSTFYYARFFCFFFFKTIVSLCTPSTIQYLNYLIQCKSPQIFKKTGIENIQRVHKGWITLTAVELKKCIFFYKTYQIICQHFLKLFVSVLQIKIIW